MTNYIGKRFHKFTIIKEVTQRGKNRRFLCRCSCGQETEQYLLNINHSNRGHVRGCRNCAKFGRRKIHGKSETREYRIWVNMKARCDNKKDMHYKNYGGRGITYDSKWATFGGFWNDMRDGYISNLTIDRVNNDGNYCKENCKWSTRGEQNTNQRQNVFIKYNNTVDTVTGWARRLGISRATLDYRIKHGWSIQKSFSKQ
jgi:hypothetical protein